MPNRSNFIDLPELACVECGKKAEVWGPLAGHVGVFDLCKKCGEAFRMLEEQVQINAGISKDAVTHQPMYRFDADQRRTETEEFAVHDRPYWWDNSEQVMLKDDQAIAAAQAALSRPPAKKPLQTRSTTSVLRFKEMQRTTGAR